MNLHRSLSVLLGLVLAGSAPAAPNTAAAPSGPELAAQLSALREGDSSFVRARMEINGAAKDTLQLQIKQRRTGNTSEVVYQVLWPKLRKGEAVLLRKVGNRPATGSLYLPPGPSRPIADIKGPLFGGDLAYEDVIDNFFAWDQQTIVGTEALNGVTCQILESKPGKGESSSYARVRSWIDTRHMVPLLIEKYSASGAVLRRIEATKVVTVGGRAVPANLTIRGPKQGSSTAIDGSKIKHDVAFSDQEFSAEGFKELAAPRGSAE